MKKDMESVTVHRRGAQKITSREDTYNWPAQLAREEQLYRRAFQAAGAARVAVFDNPKLKRSHLFYRWGMDVISITKDEVKQPDDVTHTEAEESNQRGSLTVHQGSISTIHQVVGAEKVEAIVCVDDLVTNVDELGSVKENLKTLSEALMAGGVLILETRNYTKLAYHRSRNEETIVAEDDDSTFVFNRVLTYLPKKLHVKIEDLTLVQDKAKYDEDGEKIEDTSEWQVKESSEIHIAVSADILKQELVHAGFDVIEVSGDFSGRRFSLLDDDSLVAVARKKKPRTTVWLDR